MKYGKLCTKNKYIINSKWILKDKIKSKNNYSVVVSKIFYKITKLYYIRSQLK